MKKFALIILLQSQLICSVGQAKYESYSDYALKTSEYIFEGTLVESKTIVDTVLKTAFTSAKVEITAIFRNGERIISNGTILIVEKDETKSVQDDGTYLISTTGHSKSYLTQGKGIFFCNSYKCPTSIIERLLENSEVITPIYSIPYKYLNAFGKTFKSVTEFYQFLSTQENIEISPVFLQN